MTKQITNIAQFKPLPISRGRINVYICEAPNTTEAYAGEYSVRITFNGCAINAKTTLAINSCDNLYIKAFNPLTNVETNKLIRKPNVAAKNEYEDLILQVETLDGKIIKTMDYAWTPPAGVTLVPNPNEPYKRQTNKLGRYTVQASSANGTSCPLSIDIFAEPCTVVGDKFECDSLGGKDVDANQTDLANLAVGDEFTTSDYTIVVTEASKTGTTFSGKGKLIFNFLKISNTLALQIPISVTFTGIKINQCYQLYNGSVITEYDPSWGSVVSVEGLLNVVADIKSKVTELKDLINNFNCTSEQKTKIDELVANLNSNKIKVPGLEDINSAEKNTLTTGLTSVLDKASCIKNSCGTSNTRLNMQAETCTISEFNQSSDQLSLDSKTILPDFDPTNPLAAELIAPRSKRFSKIKLKVRTYLPFNYVVEPPLNFIWDPTNTSIWPWNIEKIDLANIRDYPQYKEIDKHGSYKTKQEVTFNFLNNNVESIDFKVPETHVRNNINNSTRELINEETTQNSSLMGRYLAKGLKTFKYSFNMSSGNPAVSPSPKIDYTLNIEIREDGYWNMKGKWDGFPAIEIFAEDIETGKVDLLYSKKPIHTRGKVGNEYTDGQIFDLIDGYLFGDVDIIEASFLGFKKHSDKLVTPYLNDLNKMKVLFNITEYDND